MDPFLGPLVDAKALTVIEALNILRDFRDSLSARYEGDDAIIFSFANGCLVVNFTTHERLLGLFASS